MPTIMNGTPCDCSARKNTRSLGLSPTGSDEPAIQLLLRHQFEIAERVVNVAGVVLRSFRKTNRFLPQRKVVLLFGTQLGWSYASHPLIIAHWASRSRRDSALPRRRKGCRLWERDAIRTLEDCQSAETDPSRHGNLIPLPRAIQSGLATAIAQGEVLAVYSATLPRSQRLRLERP